MEALDVTKILVYLDDSGSFSDKQDYICFGGLVFLDDKKRDHFRRKYKKIIKGIKCSYCLQSNSSCDGKCIEVKNINISVEDKRRLMNLIKSERCFSVLVDISKVYKNILETKASKGRYLDYVKKMIIKTICLNLIKEGQIDPKNKIILIVQADQSTTKSNGYYRLAEGVLEELKYGVSNFNYGFFNPPILRNLIDVDWTYHNSSENTMIQAADIVAGTVRKAYASLTTEEIIKEISFVNDFLFLP